MRHRIAGKKFNRNASSRKALLIGLMKSLIEHGKIKTTLPKAKFLRPEIEKIITMSRIDTLSTRRLLISRIGDKVLVSKLIDQIGPMFIGRNGGYTRILKMAPRSGDVSKMAEISFVVDLVKSEIMKETKKKVSEKSEKIEKVKKVDARVIPKTEKKQKTSKKVKSEGEIK